MWAGALGGVYTLPANGTQIAAANFDLTGTTKLGHEAARPQLLRPDARHVGRHDRRRRGDRRRLLLTLASDRHTDIQEGVPSWKSTRSPARPPTLMPGVIEDLEKLVAIPSIAFPGYPAGAGASRWASVTLQLFQDVGFTQRAADGGADRLPADLRRDPGAGGLAGRGPLRALRRAAGAAGAGLDHATRGRRPTRTTAASTAAAPPTTRAAS